MSGTTTKNKVKFKLKRAYYATITLGENGSITYGTPTRIPGAVSISFSPEGDASNFYADGVVYYRATTNNGYSGDFEVALLPDDFCVSCLGETKDTADGVIVEKANVEPSPFAFLFEFEGDKKAIKHVMYFCYAARSAVEGENPESKEVKTETLTITAVPRESDDLVKAKTGESTSDEILNSWYTTVWEPSSED